MGNPVTMRNYSVVINDQYQSVNVESESCLPLGKGKKKRSDHYHLTLIDFDSNKSVDALTRPRNKFPDSEFSFSNHQSQMRFSQKAEALKFDFGHITGKGDGTNQRRVPATFKGIAKDFDLAGGKMHYDFAFKGAMTLYKAFESAVKKRRIFFSGPRFPNDCYDIDDCYDPGECGFLGNCYFPGDDDDRNDSHVVKYVYYRVGRRYLIAEVVYDDRMKVAQLNLNGVVNRGGSNIEFDAVLESTYDKCSSGFNYIQFSTSNPKHLKQAERAILKARPKLR